MDGECVGLDHVDQPFQGIGAAGRIDDLGDADVAANEGVGRFLARHGIGLDEFGIAQRRPLTADAEGDTASLRRRGQPGIDDLDIGMAAGHARDEQGRGKLEIQKFETQVNVADVDARQRRRHQTDAGPTGIRPLLSAVIQRQIDVIQLTITDRVVVHFGLLLRSLIRTFTRYYPV